jgi:diadenosine tetraphosphate (Ap4A) HIT family hydrolase
MSLSAERSSCELCAGDGGAVLWRSEQLRVVHAGSADYPGFCRVIWQGHIREMTDLSPAERDLLMAAVWRVESVLRRLLRPDKINLAALGNVVPHLHWHVIPRFVADRHFPQPIWAPPLRDSVVVPLLHRDTLAAAIAAEFGATDGLA